MHSISRVTHAGRIHTHLYLSFSQLGNSGNSAISVKDKGSTNAKMYLKRNYFSKVKI